MAGNVPLHAVIESNYMKIGLRKRRVWLDGQFGPAREPAVPRSRLIRNDFAYEIAPHQAGADNCLFHEATVIEIDGRNDPFHRPASPQPAAKGPPVDTGDANDPLPFPI